MDYYQTLTYIAFFVGTTVMVNLHNLIVSIFLYKVRETKISNFLKIIINFANVLRFGSVFGSYMTPIFATLLQCASLRYVETIGNIIIRLALTAFLLWRLNQIHNGKQDKWIGIILFGIRACLAVPQLGLQRPGLQPAEYDSIVCDHNVKTLRYYSITEIIVEILIDIYVTVRLILILQRANKNVADLTLNMGRSKRSIFTVVIYWNFLRLFVIFIFHAYSLVDLFILNQSVNITAECLINIFLSYVITADAEIVRVIEGKSNKGNNKSKSKAKTSLTMNTSDSPLPKYTPRSKQQQYGVSTKRLSFSEWADKITDDNWDIDDEITEKPLGQNNNNEDIDKIIEEPLSPNNNSNNSQLNSTDES